MVQLTQVPVGLMEEKGARFYGHGERRETARKKLSCVPCPAPRAFRRRVEDFVKKLQEQNGIRLTTEQRKGSARAFVRPTGRSPRADSIG